LLLDRVSVLVHRTGRIDSGRGRRRKVELTPGVAVMSAGVPGATYCGGSAYGGRLALGGTRRPGREGASWPPLRSSGTEAIRLDHGLSVCLGQGRRRATPAPPGSLCD